MIHRVGRLTNVRDDFVVLERRLTSTAEEEEGPGGRPFVLHDVGSAWPWRLSL